MQMLLSILIIFQTKKDKSSFLSTNRGFPFDQNSSVKKGGNKKILPTIEK